MVTSIEIPDRIEAAKESATGKTTVAPHELTAARCGPPRHGAPRRPALPGGTRRLRPGRAAGSVRDILAVKNLAHVDVECEARYGAAVAGGE
jgi:hypothetical protein